MGPNDPQEIKLVEERGNGQVTIETGAAPRGVGYVVDLEELRNETKNTNKVTCKCTSSQYQLSKYCFWEKSRKYDYRHNNKY